ncbi:hypothetical protein AA19596_1578 [Acetobacter fabarum DSM 19596]|nr:hypothetical protein AA19596_1578 [Acetobacter fabarum DSM 19596]
MEPPATQAQPACYTNKAQSIRQVLGQAEQARQCVNPQHGYGRLEGRPELLNVQNKGRITAHMGQTGRQRAVLRG